MVDLNLNIFITTVNYLTTPIKKIKLDKKERPHGMLSTKIPL